VAESRDTRRDSCEERHAEAKLKMKYKEINEQCRNCVEKKGDSESVTSDETDTRW
jgi:hypothetical protein